MTDLAAEARVMALLRSMTRLGAHFARPRDRGQLMRLRRGLGESLVGVSSADRARALLGTRLRGTHRGLRQLQSLSSSGVSRTTRTCRRLREFRFARISSGTLLGSCRGGLGKFGSRNRRLLAGHFRGVYSRRLARLDSCTSQGSGLAQTVTTTSNVGNFRTADSGLSRDLGGLRTRTRGLQRGRLLRRRGLTSRRALGTVRRLEPDQGDSLRGYRVTLRRVRRLGTRLRGPSTLRTRVARVVSTYRRGVRDCRRALTSLRTRLTGMAAAPIFGSLRVGCVHTRTSFHSSSRSSTCRILNGHLEILRRSLAGLSMLRSRYQRTGAVTTYHSFLRSLTTPGLLDRPSRFVPGHVTRLVDRSRRGVRACRRRLTRLGRGLTCISSPTRVRDVEGALLVGRTYCRTARRTSGISTLRDRLSILRRVVPLVGLTGTKALSTYGHRVRRLATHGRSSTSLSRELLRHVSDNLARLRKHRRGLLTRGHSDTRD